MRRNIALFAIMSLIWGLTWAVIKLGLADLPPFLLAATRYLLTAVIMGGWVRGAGAAFVSGRTARTVASALLVNAGTYGLLFWGIQHMPSGLAGLINLALIPIMLFALAAATGEERASWRHAVALAIGCVGLVGLFWGRLQTGGGATTLGFGAIILATAFYCVGSIVARPLIGSVVPLALTFVQAVIGGLALLVLSLLFEPVTTATLAKLLTTKAVGSLLFLAVFGTLVGYTIYLKLLREWGTARAGLYAFVSPIIALVTGHLLFGEAIGWAEVFGAVLLLIAAAVVLVSRNDSEETVDGRARCTRP